MRFALSFAATLALLCAPPARAEAPPANPAAILAEAGPGTRWGLVVLDPDGREIVAIDPDGRFMPASNTKVFTTAAAMWKMADGAFPDRFNGGVRVRAEPGGDGAAPNLVLEGGGDARLSAADGCLVDCLAELANTIARKMYELVEQHGAKAGEVHDVIGDDTIFPDQRWSPGMSWNNIPTSSGTGISALTVDDNEIAATVTPAAIGAAPTVTMSPYYTLDNHAVTVAGAEEALIYDRAPNGRTLVLSGTIGAEAKPEVLHLGVDDPADYAAWLFSNMLIARGVRVTGSPRARHRPLLPSDDPLVRGEEPVVRPPDREPLALLTPPALAEDITIINKASQNLHAELLLRRLGAIEGTGSIADGQVVVRAVLDAAGVAPHAVSLSDGSGMSSYNRVSPRGMTMLLRWIERQPWGADWRATLPVGGVDGTLARRFAGTPLAGKIFAKTGTLNATNALAGYLIAASGKELTIAIYANDVPEDVKATAIMDRALLAVAAAN
jgi:D-alanyl-D-alanine carboxypeptidase/D-alanyl-D-alanine-endopeptidase (penicillin-binding protein 4)